MSRTVAVHQPNFFPWLGWFHKVASADVFVLLDDVEFSRGSWINRTRLLVNGEPVWMTAPVVRTGSGSRTIRETRINEATPWRDKMIKTLETTYRRCPAFEEVYPTLVELVGNRCDQLASYNEAALVKIADRLGFSNDLFVSSSTLDCDSTATERLIQLVRAVGGTRYLSGSGAGGYQDDKSFEEAGIELVYADFDPQPYPQRSKEFVPGLSVIDALVNIGFSETRRCLVRR